MRRTVFFAVTCSLVGANGPAVAADRFPPALYTILGCDGPNLSAVILDCEPWPAAHATDQIACTITDLVVRKPDANTSQKNRAEFLAASAHQTEAERLAEIGQACDQLAKVSAGNFSSQAPPRQGMDRAREILKAMCECKGKKAECTTQAMLPMLDDEDRTCEIRVTKHVQGIYKKVGKGRWVYAATWLPRTVPPVPISAEDVLESDDEWLWTYKDTNRVCSWKNPVVGLLNCEHVALR